jgi:beta-glucosidase
MANQTAENPEGNVNMLGIEHYTNFFEALQEAGIEPLVTMWHWDTPNSIETQYGGLLNSTVTPILFEHYARALVFYFGKYTKYWATLNEPYTVFLNGYQNEGVHAPGHCTNRSFCPTGDDATEPYQVAYTEVLCHAYAVKAFREAKASGGLIREGA